MLNLSDRDVSLAGAFSVLLWAAGLALVLLEMFNATRTGDLGLFVAGWGGILTIRGFVCAGVAHVVSRERNAFELGRDSANVRELR